MAQGSSLTTGARHYILMVIPYLLRDIETLGLPHIIKTSPFTEREVTTLYFEFVSIRRVLPEDPSNIEAAIWEHLIYCVQVMTAMVNAASVEDLIESRKQAIQKFLPHAREIVESEYQDQCSEGTVDLRLAGMLRQDPSLEHSRDLCMEALRLERQQRMESIERISFESFEGHTLGILQEARDFVRRAIVNPPENFGVVDLVVRLLDLLRVVMELERQADTKSSIPDDFSVDNIVLGIGNSLYRQELGLTYSVVNTPKA